MLFEAASAVTPAAAGGKLEIVIVSGAVVIIALFKLIFPKRAVNSVSSALTAGGVSVPPELLPLEGLVPVGQAVTKNTALKAKIKSAAIETKFLCFIKTPCSAFCSIMIL